LTLGLASCSDDKTIKIYDLRSNQILQHYNAHAGPVYQIDFHPSGFYMASVSKDSKVKLWDLRKGEALYSLFGHTGAVKSVKFSHAGDYFATGGDDKMLLIWKTNFCDSKTTESKMIPQRKRKVGSKIVTFPNKAVKELGNTSELLQSYGEDMVEKRIEDSSGYEDIGVTEMPEIEFSKKYATEKKVVELETDDRVKSTLDTILVQLQMIGENMKVRAILIFSE
jgi:hypothetical protein